MLTSLLPLFVAQAADAPPSALVSVLITTLMILVIVILFSATVFVHEFGHYWVAKKLGFKITTFSIGFGPALWKWRSPRSGVLYKFSIIPLGGYVALPQMDPTFEITRRKAIAEGKEEQHPHAAPWKRILVALAGGVMNVAFALVLTTIVWKVGIAEGPLASEPVVGYVDEGTTAWNAGIRPGDRIVRANDRDIASWEQFYTEAALNTEVSAEVESGGKIRPVKLATTREESGFRHVDGMGPASSTRILKVVPDSAAAAAGLKPGEEMDSINGVRIFSSIQFIDTLKANGGKPIQVGVRDTAGALRELEITPRFDSKEGRHLVGILFDSHASVITHPTPGQQMTHFSGAMFRMLKAFSRPQERAQAFDNLGGPVAIFTAWYTILQIGLVKAIWFTALINVNLAIMNLLPIIILDGGHILIALYEMIFRRVPNERVLGWLTTSALALIVSLFLFITFRDSTRVPYYLGRAPAQEPAAATTNAPPASVPDPAPAPAAP